MRPPFISATAAFLSKHYRTCIAACVVTLAVAFLAIEVALPRPMSYTVRLVCTQLPENDDQLLQYMEVDPWVVRVFMDRSGKTVEVTYVQYRSPLINFHPHPLPLGKFSELGYEATIIPINRH